ncbi:HAD family hydrolase [Streptomyces sp. Ag109_O5-1]|uniref:HAD family hydrolase n=1 Tax=Streptomyces sp. Ag109_O5-1 TaxID=1938851 RepID=UPI0021A2A71E|nr:HAD-IA family hydrolase [Streptomyces sp. Ag109_O5-1]
MAAKSARETEELTELIRSARVVLWDFDGPICRLFAGHSAAEVAVGLVQWLEGRGLHGLVADTGRDSVDPQLVVRVADRRQFGGEPADDAEGNVPDPHRVLRVVDSRRPGSDLVAELEERLTEEELRATATAMPTAYADVLIQTWRALGVRMAVTTNNSPRVARAYLDARGLTACFAPHIYGRTQDLDLLKPDPHCLNRALSAMGAVPDAALMIGDSPSDLEAARRAGVPFLGYARNERKAKLLTAAGADRVVGSLEPLLEMLRD